MLSRIPHPDTPLVGAEHSSPFRPSLDAMSQLGPPDTGSNRPLPSPAKELLDTLAAAGAHYQDRHYPVRDLAADTALEVNDVREYLQWLATNGYLNYTVTDHGEYISLETTDHMAARETAFPTEITGTVTTATPASATPLDSITSTQLQDHLGYDPHPSHVHLDAPTGALEPLTNHGLRLPTQTATTVRCYPVSRIATDTATCSLGHIVPTPATPDLDALTLLAPVDLQRYLDLEPGSRVTFTL